MMSDDFHLDQAMKEAQWQRAKGEIMALVALQGSYTALGPNSHKYVSIKKIVETFFYDIETRELHR